MAQDQVDQLFGHLLPAHQQMTDAGDTSSGLQDSNMGDGPKRRRVAEQPRKPGGTRKESVELQAMVQQMAALVLRQGDDIQRLQVDTSFFLVMGSVAPQTVLPIIYKVAAEWKKLKQGNPKALDQPLRVVMPQCLLTEMMSRTELTLAKPEAFEAAIQAGLVTKEKAWTYRLWNADVEKTVVDPNRPAMPDRDMRQMLMTLKTKGMKGDTITRFQALRPLPEDVQALKKESVPFLLDISLRDQELHALMIQLCQLSIWELLGGRMRQSRNKRSMQMDKLQAMLTKMR